MAVETSEAGARRCEAEERSVIGSGSTTGIDRVGCEALSTTPDRVRIGVGSTIEAARADLEDLADGPTRLEAGVTSTIGSALVNCDVPCDAFDRVVAELISITDPARFDLVVGVRCEGGADGGGGGGIEVV